MLLRIQYERGKFQFLLDTSTTKYIETMPASDEFVAWREGKTARVNQFLKEKERQDRLAKKDIS